MLITCLDIESSVSDEWKEGVAGLLRAWVSVAGDFGCVAPDELRALLETTAKVKAESAEAAAREVSTICAERDAEKARADGLLKQVTEWLRAMQKADISPATPEGLVESWRALSEANAALARKLADATGKLENWRNAICTAGSIDLGTMFGSDVSCIVSFGPAVEK